MTCKDAINLDKKLDEKKLYRIFENTRYNKILFVI